jgi:hypothetical protein
MGLYCMPNSKIMYVEDECGSEIVGYGRICRVSFSKSGQSIRYGELEFRSLKGSGWKANYLEVGTGDWYWISGCRRDGNDALYADSIEIDADVQEEYWRDIRKLPENIVQLQFRSPGKHNVRTGFRSRRKTALILQG